MRCRTMMAAVCIAAALAQAKIDESPLDHVRAATGTINTFALSTGNVYPAICRP